MSTLPQASTLRALDFAPREVPLKRGALLLVAYVGGNYSLALYWIGRPYDRPQVQRSTSKAPVLIDALRGLFVGTPFATESPEVETYIRATRWGAGLP